MKKNILSLFVALLPSVAFSGELETDYSLSINNMYGYTDYAKQYKEGKKNNNINSSLNTYGRLTYHHNSEYSSSLIGYFMVDSAKEIENYNQGIWGEEIYGLLETPFGDISLGQDENVAHKFAVGAPNAGGFHVNNSELVNFINNPNWYKKGSNTSYKTLNSTYINTDGVSTKINYITPEYNGIKIGATYVPKTYSQTGLVAKKSQYKDESAYILGAYGAWDILDYELETSLGFADYNKNDKEYSLGASIYRKGWTLGGSFRKTEVSSNDYAINKYNLFDSYREGCAYNLGISYAFGPLTTGVSYFDSKAKNTKNQDEIISFSNSYQYNKYTTFSLTLAHVLSKGATSNKTENSKGYAFVLGAEFEL